MIQNQSVFYPIPNQFQQIKTLKRREVINKRINKSRSSQLSPNKQQFSSLPIHDNYRNIKRQLQIYIQKQKAKFQENLSQSCYSISKQKSKVIFRKKKIQNIKDTVNSVLTIPSDEVKLSFTQHLVPNSKRKRSLSMLRNSSYLSRTNYMKNHKRYGEQIQIIGHKTVVQKSNQQSNELNSNFIFRKGTNKKQHNKNDQFYQIFGGEKTQVLVCKGFKSLQVQQFQKKKRQLLKISQTLKFRNKKRLKLHKRREIINKQQIGPWSKSKFFDDCQQSL